MRALRMTLLLTAVSFVLFSLVALPRQLLFDGGESYTFYVGDTSKNCKVVTVTENAALTKLTLSGVCGEAATYASLDAEAFIAEIGGEIVFTETLSDSVNYYCAAPLPYSVTLYGKEINLHVCVKESGVTVASPMIFGGY